VIELSPFISPEKQTGSLTEGPFQMDISDLVVWAPLTLAPRLMSAFHQPCVGDEVANRGKTVDVVDLVEDHQGQGFPYTGNTAKQMNGHRIVFRNLGVDLSFDREDLLMKGIHQCPIHLHSSAHHRVVEAPAYAGTIGSAVNPFLEVGEIVLGVGVLDVRLKLFMLTNEVQAATQ